MGGLSKFKKGPSHAQRIIANLKEISENVKWVGEDIGVISTCGGDPRKKCGRVFENVKEIFDNVEASLKMLRVSLKS